MRLDIKCNNKIRNEAEKLAFISGIGKDKTSSKAQEVFQCLLVNILDRLHRTGDCSGTLLLHPKYYSKAPIINGRSIPERKVSYHYIRKAINPFILKLILISFHGFVKDFCVRKVFFKLFQIFHRENFEDIIFAGLYASR